MSILVAYILAPTGKFAGVERVVDEIADALGMAYADQISVDVLLCSDFPGMPTDNRQYTRIVTQGSNRIALMAAVRRAISRKKYDLVIVPQVEPTTMFWFSCLGLGRKFALYLHGNPKFENTHWKANVMFFLMRAVVLRQLSAVFSISPRQLDYFRQSYPSIVPHYWVPNPVRAFPNETLPPEPADLARRGNLVTFVNVGRFCRQKGQDVLLRAFALVHERRPDTRLKIVGYGPEQTDITMNISALGLSGAVSIEHHPNDPSEALRTSDVYVSASRWEGWSLAICEALRFGLPVVSTNCEFGPADILVDPRLGRLSADADEADLADKMLYYCDNIDEERAHSDFRRTYVNRFDASRVVPLHAHALMQAAGQVWTLPP